MYIRNDVKKSSLLINWPLGPQFWSVLCDLLQFQPTQMTKVCSTHAASSALLCGEVQLLARKSALKCKSIIIL